MFRRQDFSNTVSFRDGVENVVAAVRRRTSSSTDVFGEEKDLRGEQPTNNESEFEQVSLTSSDADSLDSSNVAAPDEAGYTLGDHAEYLHLRKDVGGHYYCDVGHFLVESNMSKLVKDYCSPLPFDKLNSIYFGLEEKDETKELPARTLVLRLRPDIMCGVVMDAIQEACEGQSDYSSRIIKRQQGHLRCLILPKENGAIPFCVLDATICTRRIGDLERELVLRIYHASRDLIPTDIPRDVWNEKKHIKKKSHNSEETNNNDMMIPLNLRVKDACCFLQYLSRENQNGGDLTSVPSPRSSPKACTAYFNANFDPTFSVQLVKQLRVVNKPVYPSLNSEDWSLLQNSWPLVSRIWQNLMLQNCLFHSIIDIPIVDDEEGEDSGPILDLHYCSQIRQMSRNGMLNEVRLSYLDLQRTLDEMETSYANFLQMLKRAWSRFKMAQMKATSKPPPQLDMPTQICPPGYTILATMACKCAKNDPENPTAMCDDAVRKVYKTFTSQDDHIARKNLKEANKIVMERLVDIQKTQMNLVHEIETHPSAQKSARMFCKMAREASNSKGRVERLVLARVPLLDIEIIGGLCQITSTAIFCKTHSIMGSKSSIFDLKAVDFEIKSKNCLALVSPTTREVYFKINTSANIEHLRMFLQTLQTLQSVFSINPEEAVAGMVEFKDKWKE